MAYLVLARKYRPQTFEDVAGQAHVTQTLQNAINGNRVAHAILFTGPRGTGKTTIARILAKAMNCDSGPSPTPCNRCRSCMDITAGRAVDVFEIDGASNNSVDQVRELRDNSRYMPAHSRYKIYIIDEVHMLSIAAFNALLKTLEEPPAHVMFLFATTEPHKIPITILSRCQRHDLKRIDPAVIAQHLETLCRQEGATIASNHCWTIAREAGGSMRDALSLLDQILASGDHGVDDATMIDLLGGMDRRLLFDLSKAVFARDMSRVLAVIDAVFKNGQDLKRFYADLLMHFRHLMLIKMAVGPEILADLSADEVDAMTRQVEGVSIAYIDQVFRLLFDGEAGVRHASRPRLAVELVFFKIHQVTPVLPIDQLIQRMDSLLNDSQLTRSAGVVDAQVGYGNAANRPSTENRVPPSGDRRGSLPALPAAGLPNISDRPGSDDVDVEDDWRRVVVSIERSKPSVGAALNRSRLISVSAEAFKVAVSDNDYTIKTIKKNLALIEAACREQAGRGIQIDFSDVDTHANSDASSKQKADAIKKRLSNHPLVTDAMELFGGTFEGIIIK